MERSVRLGAQFLFLLALLYGANLYFSLNADLNDPVVWAGVPLIKDAIFALVMGAYFLARRRELLALATGSLLAWALVPLGVVLAILAPLFFGLGPDTLSLVKNILLYGVGTYVAVLLLADDLGPDGVVTALSIALWISLVVGLLFLLHPVQSLDGRLYGTYGNPTSLGYAAVTLLGLELYRGRRSMILAAAIACALMFVMTGSASVLLATIVLLFGMIALSLVWKRPLAQPVLALAAFGVAFLVLGFLLSRAGLPAFGFERIGRFIAVPESLLTTDSVTVRARDLAAARDTGGYHRYDSYFLSLWRNFGALPIIAYAFAVGLIALRFVAAPRSPQTIALASLVAVLFVLNPLLQHQFEVFPTNALFSAVLAVAAWRFNRPSEVRAVSEPQGLPTPK